MFRFSLFLSTALLLFTQACGDNGKTGDKVKAGDNVKPGKNEKPEDAPLVQTFNAGLSIGDFLEAKIDTKNLSYSYEVKEGDFKGLAEGKGSGTLKLLPQFGGYAYQTSQGTLAVVVKDEVIIGAVGTNFYVGVPTLGTAFKNSDVAGVYSYVNFAPKGIAGDPSDRAGYGTVQLKEDGSFDIAIKKNLGGSPPEAADISGTYKNLGNGVVEAFDSSNKKIANLLLKLVPSGRHFMVVDLIDAAVKGIGFAQKQGDVASLSLDGSYNAIVTGFDKEVEGKVSGGKLQIIQEGIPVTIDVTYNDPWPGIVKGVAKAPIPLEPKGKLEFFGIYSESSNTLYSVIEYFADQNAKVISKYVKPTAFIAIKK